MSRPKEIKDGMRLSVVLSKKQVDQVKHMALQMSKREGRLIGLSEALRMAIEATYPVPKGQMDLFN